MVLPWYARQQLIVPHSPRYPVPPPPCRLHGGPAEGRSMQSPGRLRLANRGVLAGALAQQCLAQHSALVQLHFEQELQAIDASAGTAFFRAVGSAARGAAMASGSFSDEEEEGQGGALRQALLAERTPASPDSLASVQFDLLVGADGAGSLVRAVMQRYDDVAVSQRRDTMEYKSFVMGPAEQFLPPGASTSGTFQTWSNSKVRQGRGGWGGGGGEGGDE